MDLATPILICEENEELRLLLREMLTKHGFFHLVEASTKEEALHFISEGREKNQFVLIQKKLLSEDIKKFFNGKKNFLIFSQTDDPATVNLASRYGVKHVISFPYSSRSLVSRIQEMNQ